METKVGVGVSQNKNTKVAASEACKEAFAKAGIEGKPDFVFMFAAVGHNQLILVEEVRRLTRQAPLAGCSGEGIISQGIADEGNFTVEVMVIQSSEVRFTHARAQDMKKSPYNCGQAIGESLLRYGDTTTIGMLLFVDGITFNYDQFMEGMQTAFDPDKETPCFGGMAADNWAMKKTYQYYDDELISDGAVVVLMSGSLRIASAVNHGCVAIGCERTVTKCQGNTIYEIDNKPVLDILKEYLQEDEVDDWKHTVVNLSWGFQAEQQLQDIYDEFVIRFMPSKDSATGSVTISTEVQEGTRIWMTRRDHDKIAKGVEVIINAIQQQLGNNKPKMVFHFDCAGRGKVVFREEQKLKILASLQQAIGTTVPWIGFYTYGEIGPVGDCNNFHNYTLSLLVIY